MAKKLLIITLAFIGLAPLSSNIAWAGTKVSGIVSNPVWTEKYSPYIVDGTLEVSRGAKLRIEPGTIVKFNREAKILVKGELEAIGEPGKEIIFTSNQSSPVRGDWQGIGFSDESTDAEFNSNEEYVSGSIIKYAIIKYSNGVVCDDASPYLEKNQFINNSVGVELIGDNSSAGEQVLLGEENIRKPYIKTVYIKDNQLTDNDVGIYINRNNSNDYVLTPAGKMLRGQIANTTVIENNTLINNSKGLIVNKGDHNIISRNSVSFNQAEGVKLGSGSEYNIVEKNILNNNDTGILIYSLNNKISQNTISRNFSQGIELSQSGNAVFYNNIYDNSGVNLTNKAGRVTVAYNYWGSADSRAIEGTIEGAISEVGYKPIKEAIVAINSLLSPIINDYISPTNSELAAISGYKPTGTAVYANGREVVSLDNKADWEYGMELSIGLNKDIIYLQDKNGNKSPEVTVSVTREKIIVISEPTINSYDNATTKGSQVISGSKPVGTGIWINNSKVIKADDLSTWLYTLPLNKGENTISISAEDSEGRKSKAITIKIVRNEIDVSGIIKDEKAKTSTIDEKLSARLAGRLLLQVERDGLIWYVNPMDNKRYYVTRENALDLFRKFSLGISEADLAKIPYRESGQAGDNSLRNRLKGRFLLRVEKAGMISYVDLNGFRHDISLDNLMDIFRSLSLGVSNNDVRKITVGEIND